MPATCWRSRGVRAYVHMWLDRGTRALRQALSRLPVHHRLSSLHSTEHMCSASWRRRALPHPGGPTSRHPCAALPAPCQAGTELSVTATRVGQPALARRQLHLSQRLPGTSDFSPHLLVKPVPDHPIRGAHAALPHSHDLTHRHFEAVELYCKAGHHMEASQLLVDLAKQSAERRVGARMQLPLTSRTSSAYQACGLDR